jgi:hypothetical protein
VDFANFQRRIHSLPRADGTLPDQNLKDHHSLLQATDGTLPVPIRDRHHSLLQAGTALPDQDRDGHHPLTRRR